MNSDVWCQVPAPLFLHMHFLLFAIFQVLYLLFIKMYQDGCKQFSLHRLDIISLDNLELYAITLTISNILLSL